MLIGSTFAWFSDSVSTAEQQITAGNLQIDLLKWEDGASSYTSVADAENAVFDPAFLWEPGATQIVYLAVENKGSLAAKFNVRLTVSDGGLAEAMECLFLPGTKQNDLSLESPDNPIAAWEDLREKFPGSEPFALTEADANPYDKYLISEPDESEPDESGPEEEPLNFLGPDPASAGREGEASRKYFAVAVHMKETVEDGTINDYMDKFARIDIAVKAVQAESESDSFGSGYDQDVPLGERKLYGMGFSRSIGRFLNGGGEATDYGVTHKGLKGLVGADYRTRIRHVVFGRWDEQKSDIRSVGSFADDEPETTEFTYYGKDTEAYGGAVSKAVKVVWEPDDSTLYVLVDDPEGYVRWDGQMGVGTVTESNPALFSGWTALETVDFSCLDTSGVTNMANLFKGCTNLREVKWGGRLNGARVTNMHGMFQGCSSLTDMDFSNFSTASATDLGNLFDGCEKLASVRFSRFFGTEKNTKMQYMFNQCAALTVLDLSNFHTANVTDMRGLFKGCASLVEVSFGGNFDTAKVKWMQEMFRDCGKLAHLDVSGFETGEVTDMSGMFWGCRALTTLDVSGFDTSVVTSMKNLFNSCRSLTTLDLSGFSTFTVTDMTAMFGGCANLTAIYADTRKFNTDRVTDSANMFDNCPKLPGYGEEKAKDKTMAKYSSDGGYFTQKAS